jgi:hypothetical protein
MGVPQNEWFLMENPIEIDDLRVPPILGNLQMVNTGATALSNHTMPFPQSPLRHLAKWRSVVHPNRYLVVNIKIAACYGYSMSLHNIHLPNLKKKHENLGSYPNDECANSPYLVPLTGGPSKQLKSQDYRITLPAFSGWPAAASASPCQMQQG